MSVEQLIALGAPPGRDRWPVPHEDFARLFWKYKGLVKEADRNAAFWNATNENLKTAYERLDEQEKELERAYGLNRKYLDNIQEGLLLINRDLRIQDQFSAYLTSLFCRDDVTGVAFVDFVYPNVQQQEEEREEFRRFLSVLFSNSGASDSILEDINPLKDRVLTLQLRNIRIWC